MTQFDAVLLARRAYTTGRFRRGPIVIVRTREPFLVAWRCDCGVAGAATGRRDPDISTRPLALAAFVRRHARCEVAA